MIFDKPTESADFRAPADTLDAILAPRCQPGRLWSLWDMREWDGAGLARVTGMLHAMSENVKRATRAANNEPVGILGLEELIQSVESLKRVATSHAFDVLPHAASDLLDFLHDLPEPNVETGVANVPREMQVEFEHVLEHLLRTVEATLRSRVMLVLSLDDQRLYHDHMPLFGYDVFKKFPDAERDISEAGKCLALDRTTATVFHLMRAMELALRALALKLEATITKPSGEFLPWLAIVGEVKKKIDAMPVGSAKDDWTEIHNLLWGVGKAWRNTTMHPAMTYTSEDAETIFDAVKGFMRHLAPLV